MSLTVDPILRNLNDCDCCEGTTAQTPAEITNLPGLTAIVYRVGTYSQFKQSMLARLSASDLPALRILTTRDNDDFTIALLDAWATVADVLTFYQERIANESYLRTATELVSILHLARLIGYELRPGVAASTYLAFTLEDAQGAPQKATIDIGTKVQSIPSQGEQAQIFETIEKIEARAEWNVLQPKLTELKTPESGDTEIYLKGITTGLKSGDGLLFIGEVHELDLTGGRWDFRWVKDVYPDPQAGYTRVTWDSGLEWNNKTDLPVEKNIQVYVFRQRASLFGYNAPDWNAIPDSVKKNYIIAPIGSGTGLYGEYFSNIDPNAVSPTVIRIDPKVDFYYNNGSNTFPPSIGTDNFSARWTGFVQPEFTGIYTFHTNSDDGVRLWVDGKLIINNWTDHGQTDDFGTIALVAGHIYDIKLEYYQHLGAAVIQLFWSGPNLPEEIIPASHLYTPDFYQNINEWPGFTISSIGTLPDIYLDAIYSEIVPGSWLVLSIPDRIEIYKVNSVTADSRTNFTLSSKVSRITLQEENLKDFDTHVRDTVVFAQSELLTLAERPLTTLISGSPSEKLTRKDGTLTPIEGSKIELDRLVSGLEKGHELIVSGKRLRARIADTVTANGLALVSADGMFNISLQAGDILQVMESPIVTDGNVKWHLRNRDGFDGFVSTALDDIILEPAAADDETICEVVTIEEASGDPTIITLRSTLHTSYDRSTVVIYANVAKATHGETVQEVLGSGDASQPYQRFTLHQPPLTYTSAPTPSGAESTLLVRVNDLQWHEVSSLYGHSSRDRIFVTRTDEDGKTTVQFGDGRVGMRLPTGLENVRATYRKGIGVAGNVDAGQLSMLMTRPLGVKGVINPLAASGGADGESLDDARQNAPLTVLTLDRIVSLQDFENFARAFAGIAKALATWTWIGQTRGVFITVAGPDGAEIKSDSDLYKNLLSAMKKAGDSYVPIRVESYRKALFRIAVMVKIDPDYRSEQVLAAVENSLRLHFSFDAREFGQPVTLSEVMAVIQAVPGVQAADVDKLYLGQEAKLNFSLAAEIPQPGIDGTVSAAQLLTLDPGPLDYLGVML